MNFTQPAIARHASFILSLLLLGVAFPSAISFLMDKWLNFDHGTYNHGFLLLAVAAYFLIKNTEFSQKSGDSYSSLGLLITILFMLAAFFLSAINIVSLQVVLIYGMLLSLILTYFGLKVAKMAIFPMAILAFAIPVWDVLGSALQTITANMSYFLVKLTGISIIKEGFFLIVPAGSFEVATSCSGLSYFLAAAPLAIIYAVQNYRNNTRRSLIIAAILLASLISNWIRVMIIVIVGQLTDMQHSLVHDHFNLGWIVFAVFFVGLMFLFSRFVPNEGINVARKSYTVASSRMSMLLPAIIIGALFAIIAANKLLQPQLHEVDTAKYQAANIAIPQGFQKVAFSPLLDIRQLPGISKYLYLSESDGKGIYLYHGVFPHQKQGEELISEKNKFIDESKWIQVSKDVLDSVEGGVNRYELRSNLSGDDYIIWQWYEVNGVHTASKMIAKINEFYGYVNKDNSGAVLMLIAQRDVALDRFSTLHSLLVSRPSVDL